MIEWLDTPFKGTNKADGFETLVHGFAASMIQGSTKEIQAICVDQEGQLYATNLSNIVVDWRYKRGKGWFSIDDQEDD